MEQGTSTAPMEHPIDLVDGKPEEEKFLYAGQGSVLVGGSPVQRHVELHFGWRPYPQLRLSVVSTSTTEAFQGLGEPIELLELLDAWPQPASRPQADPTAGERQTPINDVMLGADEPVTDVLVYVLNFTSGLSGIARAFEMEFGPWRVGLEPSVRGSEMREYLRETGLYGVTHVAHIRRDDGTTFRWDDDATELLVDCLWYALSSLNGTMVGFALPAGFFETDVRWCEASVTSCHRARHALAWGDTHHLPAQARELAPAVHRAFSDPFLREVLARIIRITIEANDASPLDTAIPTAQAGLELMAWIVLVERERWLHPDARLDAAARIRLLLRWADIPVELPEEFVELRDWCSGRISEELDGPRAITFIRRALVHPPKKVVDWPDHDALHLAWRLALGYLELSTLRLLGYDGVYASRHYLDGRWVGTVEPVPWT